MKRTGSDRVKKNEERDDMRKQNSKYRDLFTNLTVENEAVKETITLLEIKIATSSAPLEENKSLLEEIWAVDKL